MALNAYLKLKGKTQGDIKGSVTQKGREDSIMVIAVQHEIVSPRDEATGGPTGKRRHRPLVVTKELDKSSPLLQNVLVNNENIETLELKFWRPSATGQEQQHFTIELKNANIAGIKFVMENNKHPDLMRFAEYEQVSFTYEHVIWTWTDGGITAEDNWQAPNA